MIVSATDLKIHGVSLLEKTIATFGQGVISVRGQKKFVVLPADEYEEMREDQISLAIKEAEEDIKNGDYHTDTERFFREVGIH